MRGKENDDNPFNEIFGSITDLTATFNLSDLWGIGLNMSYRQLNPEFSDTEYWAAAAVYADYALTNTFKMALRLEHIYDSDGIILNVDDTQITSLTLSGNIQIQNLRLIPEFRIDAASNDVFLDQDFRSTANNAAVVLGVVYGF